MSDKKDLRKNYKISDDVIDNYNQLNKEYELGFHVETKPTVNLGKGLSRDTIIAISKYKNEPEWMLNFRLDSYEKFLKIKNPNWGPDLNFIDFQDFTYEFSR